MVSQLQHSQPNIICLTGPMGSGKGEVGIYCRIKYGYSVYPFYPSLDIELTRNQIIPTRRNFQKKLSTMQCNEGPYKIATLAKQQIKNRCSQKVILDGARCLKEVMCLHQIEFGKVVTVYVDAPIDVRRDRIIRRRRSIDPQDTEELRKVMLVDLHCVKDCKDVNGVVILNNIGDINFLHSQIDRLMAGTID
mgnify:CR=1 FL=1